MHRTQFNRHRRLCCEMLEDRRLLAGITLITHGFNSGASGWVTSMADAIVKRAGLSADEPRYLVKVTDPGHTGGALSVTATQVAGKPPALSPSSEIIVLLDWSDVAGSGLGGYHRSTVDVAAAVVSELVTPGFLPNLATAPAELPFQLIGHSRGGSLVGEMAKDLGESGVWVDQVTTLDPHPVAKGPNSPQPRANWGDAPMVAWRSVVFWDNYWRTNPNDWLDFTGVHVPGVYNVKLNNSILSKGGYDYAHSNVHLWYDGTIDLTATSVQDGASSYSINSHWYGGADPSRAKSGYYFSRLVNGPRPAAGISGKDFVGGKGSRTDLPTWSGAVWPDVLNLQAAGSTFTAGQGVPVHYYYQDVKGGATITFMLDADRNPYDAGTMVTIGTPSKVVTHGAIDSKVYHVTGSLAIPAGVGAGTYYVMAEISDGLGHTRYDYAPTPIVVSAAAGGLTQGLAAAAAAVYSPAGAIAALGPADAPGRQAASIVWANWLAPLPPLAQNSNCSGSLASIYFLA